MNPACVAGLVIAGVLLVGLRSAIADEAPRPALPDRLQEECWLIAPAGDPEIPCSIEHDMNRDGKPDRAVLVRERHGKRRRGIAIQFSGGVVEVLAAGRRVGALGADLTWMKGWTVLHPRDADRLERYALFLGPALPARPGKLPASVLVVPHGEDAEMVNLYRPRDEPGGVDALGLADSRRRFVAFDLLSDYQVEPAKRWLLPGLDEQDEIVRLAVAGVLASSKVTEASEAVASWLQPGRTDVSPFTRAEIVRDLGRMGSPAGIPALRIALADAAPDVREAAVWALGAIGGGVVTDIVAKQMDDPDPRVRRAVAATLGGLPGAGAQTALMNALADADQRARLAAVESIRKSQVRAAIPTLIERLHDLDGEVRYAAVETLGTLRARDAVSALVPLLQRSETVRRVRHHQLCWAPAEGGSMQCAVARALVSIGDPSAIAEAKTRVPHCLVGP